MKHVYHWAEETFLGKNAAWADWQSYAAANYNPVTVHPDVTNKAYRALDDWGEYVPHLDWICVGDTFYFTLEDQAVMFKLLVSGL